MRRGRLLEPRGGGWRRCEAAAGVAGWLRGYLMEAPPSQLVEIRGGWLSGQLVEALPEWLAEASVGRLMATALK